MEAESTNEFCSIEAYDLIPGVILVDLICKGHLIIGDGFNAMISDSYPMRISS
jgi:hypothetical protein